MQLVRRNLTGGTVAFAIYRMRVDKSIVFQPMTQAEYDGWDKQGFPPNAPVNIIEARFLCSGGGRPALDTPTGFPSVGDYWFDTRTNPQTGNDFNAIVFCTSTVPDFDYTVQVADSPLNNRSRVLGFIARRQNTEVLAVDTVQNRLDLNQGTFNLTRPLVTIVDNELTIDPLFSRDENIDLDFEIDNHRSVTFDATSGFQSSGVSSGTWAHVTAVQSDRYMAILSAHQATGAQTASTYNSVNSSVLVAGDWDGLFRTAYEYLVAPATGSNNVTVYNSSGSRLACQSTTCYGVDQTTPHSTTAQGYGVNSGTSPTITLTGGATDEIAIVLLQCWNTPVTPDATWTTDCNRNVESTLRCYVAHTTGAASVTCTVTTADPNIYGRVGASVKAAASSSPPIKRILIGGGTGQAVTKASRW